MEIGSEKRDAAGRSFKEKNDVLKYQINPRNEIFKLILCLYFGLRLFYCLTNKKSISAGLFAL